MTEVTPIEDRDYVYLHEYIASLPLHRRKELTKRVKKPIGGNYIIQIKNGINRPPIWGPEFKAIKRFYKQHPIDGKELTDDGVAEGYELMRQKQRDYLARRERIRREEREQRSAKDPGLGTLGTQR